MPYPGRPGASPVVAALVASGVLRREDRVIDLGCGTGADAVALAGWGFRRVVGVDHDKRALAVARRRAAAAAVARRVRFEAAEANELPFRDASFDAALDTLLLNNLRGRQIAEYAREVARILAPDGVLVVSERVSGRMHREPRDAVPPEAFHPYFDFGPTTPTHIPERPPRGAAPPWARVVVTVGWRNGRSTRKE